VNLLTFNNPAFAAYVIAASKEEEFYPDRYPFYRDLLIPFPEVTISEQVTHQKVTTNLGPKAGKLVVKKRAKPARERERVP